MLQIRQGVLGNGMAQPSLELEWLRITAIPPIDSRPDHSWPVSRCRISSTSTSTYASVYASTSATASASAPTSNSFLWSTRWYGESISHHNWPNTTTIVHHDALVVLHIQSRCISRELRSRVLTADIPTRRQDNGRGPLGHRAHASSPPALGRALLACPGNQQPTAASRQRTPGTRGGPHVRRA